MLEVIDELQENIKIQRHHKAHRMFLFLHKQYWCNTVSTQYWSLTVIQKCYIARVS